MTGFVEEFGRLEDGTSVECVAIRKDDLSAKILTWGAIVQDLRLQGVDHPLVLGLNRIEDYVNYAPFFGAIAGRFANRIDNSTFTLDGRDYPVSKGPDGAHHLHGGTASFGKRPWQLDDHGSDFVTLRLNAQDGEAGYPGNLVALCTYRIVPGNVLSIELTATTDAPTIINLAHHSYFNLDSSSDIGDHTLTLAAETYLPVRPDLIPTGEIKAVDGTPYDFRTPRKVATTSDGERVRYDENFVLAKARRPNPESAARLVGTTGLAMEVWTTEPGVQFYDGAKVAMPVKGLDGRAYGAFSGVCLEPQIWPDSPNRQNFPDATLRPGDTYRQVSEFRFSQ